MTKRYRTGIIVILIAAWVWMGGAAWAEAPATGNACVDCHRKAETVLAMPSGALDPFIHWYGSIHGRKGVTCDRCHGGDPKAPDREKAHEGMSPSKNPESRIYYKNLPETCGVCHKEVYAEFIKSRHYKNLKADRLAPTCTTCHGFQMDIRAVDPLQLAGRCEVCHNTRQGVKPEVGRKVREVLDHIDRTRHSIERARVALELVHEAEGKEGEARDLLKTATDRMARIGALWHRFDLAAFEKTLSEIQARAERSLSEARGELSKNP